MPVRGFLLGALFLCAIHLQGQFLSEKQLTSKAQRVLVSLQDIDHLSLGNSSREDFSVRVSGPDKAPAYRFEAMDGIVSLSAPGRPWSVLEPDPDKVCSIEPLYSSYELRVPDGTEVFVTFTAGNFDASDFSGDLQLVLEDGIVQLDGMRGSVSIMLNGGSVSVGNISDMRIDAGTSLGSLDYDPDGTGSRTGMQRVQDTVGNPVNELKIEAIMANVLLRSHPENFE